MSEIIFVLGGCRSGKSSHALALANNNYGQKKIFIATCVPRDDEMNYRVKRHQEERGQNWTAVETPVAVYDVIDEYCTKADVILLDCLTLWMNNLIMETTNRDKIAGHVQKLTDSLKRAKCPVIVVSNEVGCGIVPDNALTRQYRDETGFTNQRVATCADKVDWVVAGIPVTIKGK
ncbi:MAG: bifunctional adenosylcobinamide kinase/adenosylcobinamide-phosphate guanylyltransferase [Desulfobacterales bacterium]|nr:bifunctional adenosylcobinamide kinase/adenosylcobinamide-phosphate guanylyltransferase [Desulfobacterales bacterium]